LLYFGPASMGGNGYLDFPVDMLVSGIFSLLIMMLALATGVPAEASQDYLAQLTTEGEEAAP
jgi:hypothetical protein